jgi:hypothetical protein
MGSPDEENMLVDKAFGVYINEMIKQTLRVYTLSVALSQRDPCLLFNETIQEALQQTGLANIFNLFWEKLVHILKQSLQKVENMYGYLYQSLSARYFVFLQGLKLFWDKILGDVMPTDKIRILQLKKQLFSAVDVLKQRYVQVNVVK